MAKFFLFKQIQVWATDLFHTLLRSKYTYKHSTKQYIKSSEKQEIAA